MRFQFLLVFLGLIIFALDATGQGGLPGGGQQDTYESKDNQTGLWNVESTWTGDQKPDNAYVEGKVTVYGFVEWDKDIVNETELRFGLQPQGGSVDALIVEDTLIVYGDLYFETGNNLIVEDGGVLIVYGSLSAQSKIEISPKGYLVVQEDLNLNGGAATVGEGDVENIFVGGEQSGNNFDGAQDDSALEDEDGSLDDFYKGKDPTNMPYSISPDTTDICSRTEQEVTLYFSGGDEAEAIENWQLSTDGATFSEITDTEGQTSYTVTSTETRYYRVQYIPEGGTESSYSDTALVFCNNLCTMTVTIDLADGSESPACYSEGVSFGFTSATTDGTPESYSWEIASTDDPNADDVFPEQTDPTDQVTYSGFPNPEATAWEYTVTLTVTDAEGCSATDSQTITLQRRPETGNAYHVPNEFDQ